jgi:cyclophilin family peptidyl-prolyl cis-trans isomerase
LLCIPIGADGLGSGCVARANRAGNVVVVIAERRRSSLFVAACGAVALLGLGGCGSSSPAAAPVTDTAVVAAPPVSDASAAPSVAASGGAFGSTACPPAGGTPAPVREFTAPFQKCIDPAKTYIATMVTTKGTMIFQMRPDKAPGAVNNFVSLARSKYFDGIYFHRVMKDFVLQGGDPTVITEAAIPSGGRGGPGYDFADELPQPGEYKVGDLAMANSGENTNGSQFFVISGPQGAGLPPSYSLFASMTADPATLETIKAIDGVSNAGDGPPTEAVMIKTVTIEEK